VLLRLGLLSDADGAIGDETLEIEVTDEWRGFEVAVVRGGSGRSREVARAERLAKGTAVAGVAKKDVECVGMGAKSGEVTADEQVEVGEQMPDVIGELTGLVTVVGEPKGLVIAVDGVVELRR